MNLATALDILDAIDQYDLEQEVAKCTDKNKSESQARIAGFYEFIDSQTTTLEK